MNTNVELSTLSLAQLHSVLTQLSPEGSKVPKALRSVKDGVARIEALGFSAIEIEATEDGVIAVGQMAAEEPEQDEPTPPEGIDPTEDAEEPSADPIGEDQDGSEPGTGGDGTEDGGEGDEEPQDAPTAAAPFVKATKEELTAMDAATRADYRKRRRAAARAARKAKAA